MSKKYPIINPKADCIIRMYADEPISMDHPIVGIRNNSLKKAGLYYQQAIPLRNAIETILEYIRHLFGKDIPEELVISTVAMVYAEQTAWNVEQKPCRDSASKPQEQQPVKQKAKEFTDGTIVTNCQLIMDWLLQNRHMREPVDIKRHKYWPFHPKATISGMAAGVIAWYSRLTIDNNTTEEELLAAVTMKVMESGYIVRGANVSWSETDKIRILKTSHPRFAIREYPHIETYNCILYYPKDTKKDVLIKTAQKIAATWCPSVSVLWSPGERIWLGKDSDIRGLDTAGK